MSTPSDFVKNWSHGTTVLNDGAGTPNSITLDHDVGDLSVSGLTKKLRAISKYERRGKLKSVAHAGRVYPTFTMSILMSQFSDVTEGTFSDFISLAAGTAYAANVSTLGANHEVHAIQIVQTYAGTAHGDDVDHTFTLNDCVITDYSFTEGDPNTISISGEVLGTITGDLPFAEA